MNLQAIEIERHFDGIGAAAEAPLRSGGIAGHKRGVSTASAARSG
jgi:hypothetical protein